MVVGAHPYVIQSILWQMDVVAQLRAAIRLVAMKKVVRRWRGLHVAVAAKACKCRGELPAITVACAIFVGMLCLDDDRIAGCKAHTRKWKQQRGEQKCR